MKKNEKKRKTNKYRKPEKKEKDTLKNPQCFSSFYLFEDVVFRPFVILKMGKKSKKVSGTK
jgi:hypothetical protein